MQLCIHFLEQLLSSFLWIICLLWSWILTALSVCLGLLMVYVARTETSFLTVWSWILDLFHVYKLWFPLGFKLNDLSLRLSFFMDLICEVIRPTFGIWDFNIQESTLCFTTSKMIVKLCNFDAYLSIIYT